jgi:hypothetical protein
MIGVPRTTSVWLFPGSTATTFGAGGVDGALDTGFGLLLGSWDLFFGDRAEAADRVGFGRLVIDVDGAGLLDLAFELLLFGLVLGNLGLWLWDLLSTYS